MNLMLIRFIMLILTYGTKSVVMKRTCAILVRGSGLLPIQIIIFALPVCAVT